MISVDTNILVRILVDDESDRGQVEKARQAVQKYGRIYVSHIVVAETIWVLKSLYSFQKDQIVKVLEHMLSNRAFVLENETVYRDALVLFSESNVDFSDTLILIDSRHKGYPLLTFDKKLLRLGGTIGVEDSRSNL